MKHYETFTFYIIKLGAKCGQLGELELGTIAAIMDVFVNFVTH